MPPRLNLVGKRFGKILVIEYSGVNTRGDSLWVCRCDCGNKKNIIGASMKNGLTSSCGCGVREAAIINNTTHGDSKGKLYLRWRAMLNRCKGYSSQQFRNYSGRGIKVCERWFSYESFKEDMGDKFHPDLELDRINTDGDYEPSNCRWVDIRDNQRNRRNNHKVTIDGETKLLVEWEELTGIKANTILTRIRRGWPSDKLLKSPKQDK